MRPTRFGGGCGGRATYAGWGEFGGGLCDLRWLGVDVVVDYATYAGWGWMRWWTMQPTLVGVDVVNYAAYAGRGWMLGWIMRPTLVGGGCGGGLCDLR